MSPTSPLTNNNNTSLSASYNTKDIIDMYRVQTGIDVSRFFGKTKEIFLYRCNDSGYRFYYPKGLDGDGIFYEELQAKLANDYYHDWKFENQMALEAIRPGDKILDIGCGEGKFLQKALVKSKSVYGIELNAKAAGVAVENGIEVHTETIEVHAINHIGYYDMVCMFQVLEHIYEVNEFLEASLKVLKPGGKLIIGVPNNEPYFNGYDKYCTLNLPPHHMGMWNISVFRNISTLFDISIQEVQYEKGGGIFPRAYLHAKYLNGIKSLPGSHTLFEKIRIGLAAILTLPLCILSRLTQSSHGAHMAVIFQKN